MKNRPIPKPSIQNGVMQCAGILLTGGASRRMGQDKASLVVDDGVTLAARTGALLAAVCIPAVEVGPGRSGRPVVPEPEPGAGPLAGLVAGFRFLARPAPPAAVLVVATDLPRLTEAMLRWLAEHPSTRSVVPVRGGRAQPLCARYTAADLRVADELVATGARSMMEFLQAVDPLETAEAEWARAAGGAGGLDDVDTPEDLARMAGR